MMNAQLILITVIKNVTILNIHITVLAMMAIN